MLLLEKNFDFAWINAKKILQKKLEHQNISVTLNTYTDIFSAYEDKYDEQQENYLKEQGIGLL